MTEGSDAEKRVDQELIRALAKLLKETELSEIEIEQNGLRVKVARHFANGALPVSAAPPASAAPQTPPPDDNPSKHPGAVPSPMVGTVYLAPEPGAPAFVKLGDTVTQGQTLLIVEAMKTMNHIAAPRAGRITRILVQNGQAVEYGEPLVIIE